jgi:hypothetical protein
MFYSYNSTKILNGIGAFKAMPRELEGVDDIFIIHGESFGHEELTRNTLE